MTAGALLERAVPLVERARLVPEEFRRFSLPARQVQSLHRIPPELLDALVEAGLPHAGGGDGRLFDDYDTGNIGLHLGLPSVRRRAMRSWAGALRRVSGGPPSRWRVGYAPACPAPGHRGDCRFALLVRGGRRVEAAGGGDGRMVLETLTVDRPACGPELGPAQRELLEEAAGVEFFLLPEPVRWDLDFLRRTGLADCGGVTKLLVSEGRRRGLAVRLAFGLLLAKPYSTPHCWAEFEVDGHWVPADPMLLRLLAAWGGLPAGQWPPWRSPRGLFEPLDWRFNRVAVHGRLWAPLSLPTEVSP